MAHPAVQTDPSPRRITAIVSKVVIPRIAQFIALVPVVVLIATHLDAVGEPSHRPVMDKGLPGIAGVDHAGANVTLDQQQLLVVIACFIVPVPGLHNQRKCPQPCKLEGDHDLASLLADPVVLCDLERKYIPAENRRRSGSERASPRGGDLHLVLLQAHSQVSVTLVPGAAQVLGAPGAVAALPACQLAVHILYGDQLQLKIAG